MNQNNTYKQSLANKIGDVNKKILDVSGLVTAIELNAKIGEVENKIPDVSGYNRKILDFEKKYFNTSYYNKFSDETFDAKIKEKRLVDDKSSIYKHVKKMQNLQH